MRTEQVIPMGNNKAIINNNSVYFDFAGIENNIISLDLQNEVDLKENEIIDFSGLGLNFKNCRVIENKNQSLKIKI